MPICYYVRCCEYALLILEYWADAPEIHRSADLYENLIKSCVSDAMSEVLRPEHHLNFLTYFILIFTVENLNVFFSLPTCAKFNLIFANTGPCNDKDLL